MTIRKVKTSGKAPCPRFCHGAAFLGDSVYFYGGIDKKEECLGDLHALRVPTGLAEGDER